MTQGKPIKILSGQVTMYMKEFANPSSDAKSISISEAIETELGYHHGGFTGQYAEVLAYLLDMQFNWDEDTPYYQKNLEVWWDMVQKGKTHGECYVWIMENVENDVHNSMKTALIEAHMKPKPRREKLVSLESVAEKDPNS